MADEDVGAGSIGQAGAGLAGPRITLERWLKTLDGTADEVWKKLLRLEAKVKVAEAEAWQALLEDLRGRPAHKQ